MRDSSSRLSAFTLAETIGAIFILAVVAAVCVAIIANRNTQFDKTAAMSGAPAAIDALSYYFDNKAEVAATHADILSGKAVRVVCRVRDGEESLWQVAEGDAFTSMEGVSGPVYVATLRNPTLYEHSRAVEFDVSLGWVAPGAASESAAEIQTRIAAPSELCQYRAIILRK